MSSSSTYLETILQKIEASKLPIATIARETNINARWLYALVNRKMELEALERIMRINDYIDKHQQLLAELKSIKD